MEPAGGQPERAPGRERPATARSRVPVIALYSATLGVSAALVFMVQPMFARFVLPLLGGTPAVWTTAMLFFQTTLLLAYVYAHWSTRRFGARRQAALHLALVAAALLVLPLGVPGWSPPAAGSPVLWLLALLAVSVGLPFFVVSSTAPLLQSWLAATDHPDGRDPYFLYRASNLGSVVGLLAYPALVERELTLDGQSWLWSAGYALLGLLLTACAVVLWRARGPVVAAVSARVARSDPLTTARRLRWVALGFVPSSLMLAVTAAITTNLAPIPLLWVLPLSLYLISFIVVFSREDGPGIAYRVATFAMPPFAVAAAGVIVLGLDEPLWLVGLVQLAAFFAIALVCHGQLAADRPSTDHLTQFYALISVGGALGGVLNVLIAPLVFNSLTEYPLVLLLACLMLPFASGSWRDQLSFRRHLLPPLALGVALLAVLLVTSGPGWERWVAYVAAGLACVALARNPMRFALAVAAVMVAAWIPTLDDSRVIYRDRSFFAVNQVESTQGDMVHLLKNGTIVHGAQIGGLGLTPVTYFHRTGPVGQLFEGLPDRSIASRTGIVGLGTGSLACYSRPGDRFTFFEIDPVVEKLARDGRLFGFLRDCKGRFDVVLGDARLSLARRREREFGVLVLDAFSSDAIPVHLLSREAIELYERKLRPGGVLAIHISNKYLDLEPVVGNLAHDTGYVCRSQRDGHVTNKTWMKFRSHWVALARRGSDLGRASRDPRWEPCRREPDARSWTDDYSNVLGTFNFD